LEDFSFKFEVGNDKSRKKGRSGKPTAPVFGRLSAGLLSDHAEEAGVTVHVVEVELARRGDAEFGLVLRENARRTISQILLDVFEGLKMAYPKPDAKRRRELQLIRQTRV
jgi:hypothetical protein